jgi:KaiC/GvpD/RAD55 family RecA-like ATPase
MSEVVNYRLTAALSYALRGWKVIPLHSAKTSPRGTTCSCGKADCGSIGKHPLTVNGLTDATDDMDVVRAWWQKWPAANIGLVTGAVSGIFAVDEDPRHGGDATLREVVASYGALPETIESATGGGGRHLLFKHPGRKVKNDSRGALIGAGLDVRGDGGYIVAPPSNHASGEHYTWAADHDPGHIRAAEAPAWLLAMVCEKEQGAKPPPAPTPRAGADKWLARAFVDARAGNRNDVGFWLACQLRDSGMSEGEAATVMRRYAVGVTDPSNPYTEREALASARSAFNATARDPAKGSEPAPVRSTPLPEPPRTAAGGGAAAELQETLQRVSRGEIYAVSMPWPGLAKFTNALLPGSTTCLVGDPGVGKTFFVLQACRHWYANGESFAVFFVEKDRVFHTNRLLAQLEGSGKYVDMEWVRDHPADVQNAIERHREFIDQMGENFHSAPSERVTLPNLLAWIEQQAKAGKRVIVVDPVTAISAGRDRWTADEDFMLGADKCVRRYGVSLVLVTHARKGNRVGASTGHDMAGGAAYLRFCDATIWLARPKKPKRVQVRNAHGIWSARFEIFAQVHKARNGKGGGMEFAFTFGEGLEFAEQGWVTRDLPDRDEQQDEQEKPGQNPFEEGNAA